MSRPRFPILAVLLVAAACRRDVTVLDDVQKMAYSVKPAVVRVSAFATADFHYPIEALRTTEAALRHFAEYGLGAAKAALAQAGEARRNGDEAQAHYWLDICTRLDRQAAMRFERSNEALIG